MFSMPSFADKRLRSVVCCTRIDFDDHPELREWFEGKREYLIAAIERAPGERIFFRRMVNGWKDSGHFHLEATVESEFTVVPEADADIDKVLEEVQLLGGASAFAVISGTFLIHEDELPEEGIICSLAGLQEVVNDETELTLRGGTLSVESDGPIDEITWKLAEDDQVRIEISGCEEVVLDSELLANVGELIRAGFEQIIRPQIPDGTTKHE